MTILIAAPGDYVTTRWSDPSGRCILFDPGLDKGEPFSGAPGARKAVRRVEDKEVLLVLAHHKSNYISNYVWVEVLAHDGIYFVDSSYIAPV